MSLVKSTIETLEGDITLEQSKSNIKDATSKSMSKTLKRRLANKTREEEKIWFNKTIESKITRKLYNRQKRVEDDKEKKNILEMK